MKEKLDVFIWLRLSKNQKKMAKDKARVLGFRTVSAMIRQYLSS